MITHGRNRHEVKRFLRNQYRDLPVILVRQCPQCSVYNVRGPSDVIEMARSLSIRSDNTAYRDHCDNCGSAIKFSCADHIVARRRVTRSAP